MLSVPGGSHGPTWVDEMDTDLLPTSLLVPGTSCVNAQGPRWKACQAILFLGIFQITFCFCRKASKSGGGNKGNVSKSEFHKRTI